MTVGELQVAILQIKILANQEGLTDIQVGNLEICELHQDRKGMMPIKVQLDFSRIKTRRNPGGEFFVNFEQKASSRLAIIKG